MISGRHKNAVYFWVLGLGGMVSERGLATDKSGYHVFRPTPKSEMRELSTDRPDKTESPYTVDAGHYQVETDILSQSRDKPTEDSHNTSNLYLYSNFKVGLTNGSDLQIIVSPQQVEVNETAGVREEKKGLSDTVVRLKINLLGNDGGDLAIGLMPFVKVPTAAAGLGNKKVEGGIILPFALALPQDWSLGLMAQVNYLKNEADGGMHATYINTFTVGHDVWGALAGYLEFYSESSQEQDAAWVATVDLGVTYGLTPDVQLDFGANIGVTAAADDLNPFVGFSARL